MDCFYFNGSSTGVIIANGGSGGGGIGGGGSGGRIAIYYSYTSYTGVIRSFGGSGAFIIVLSVSEISGYSSGGPGTTYLQDNTQGTTNLVVDNNGIDSKTAVVTESPTSWYFNTLELKQWKTYFLYLYSKIFFN